MSGTTGAITIPLPTVPPFDVKTGQMSQAWQRFFLALLARGGGVSGAAGGDLSGSYPNPNVAKIAGAPLGSTAVTSGHLLVANGVAWASVAMSGDATINSSGVVSVSGSPPSGSAGGDLSGTYPNPAVAKINGGLLGSTTPTSGNLLIGSGSAWVTHGMAGDATITSAGTITITGVNGAAVPTSAAVLASNASKQLVTATTTGTGTTVPLATNPTLTGVTVDGNGSLHLTSQTSDAGAQNATLTNAPAAGDPTFWVRISVNGTALAIPAWPA